MWRRRRKLSEVTPWPQNGGDTHPEPKEDHSKAQQSQDLFEYQLESGCVTYAEWLAYWLENLVSVSRAAPFALLLVATFGITLVLASLLYLDEDSEERWEASEEDETPEQRTWSDCLFFVFQVVWMGGNDDSIRGWLPVLVFIMMVFASLILGATLVGMVTEQFVSTIEHINEGKTKVAASNHTLILGWNESTVRVVVQLAFLRRQYKIQNETCSHRIFPWLKTRPSTPIAVAPIVVMCDTLTKAEMQDAIKEGLESRGISRKRTRVGTDVVCRVGDPTNPPDLVRVGAHRAKAVLLQTTEQDAEEEEASDTGVPNCVTLRVLLALRYVIFCATGDPTPWEDLRVVVQLASPSKAIEAATFEAPDGRSVVTVQDLSLFINSLMFSCVTQPGLAYALMKLLSFEGEAFRVRKVTDFPDRGAHLLGKKVGELRTVWEDGIFCGLVGPAFKSCFDTLEDGEGFAPDHHREVRADDHVIFISWSSVPMVARGPRPPRIAEKAATSPKRSRGMRSMGLTSSMAEGLRVLVCGWRMEWYCPERFAQRLRETADMLPPGSLLHFFCTLPEAEFAELMAQAAAVEAEGVPIAPGDAGAWMIGEGVSIRHTAGDATRYAELEGFLADRIFDKVMILSTLAKGHLSARGRDMRVLSVMLFLRHLQQVFDRQPMHIVGDNALDSTALLAPDQLNPRGTEIPDFVNVHAICARALTQSLAYPRMAPYLGQLCSRVEGSPSLQMVDAGLLLPWGCYAFGAVARRVLEAWPSDVFVGIREVKGRLIIAPCLADVHEYVKGDRLVLISRRTTDEVARGTSKGLLQSSSTVDLDRVPRSPSQGPGLPREARDAGDFQPPLKVEVAEVPPVPPPLPPPALPPPQEPQMPLP